MSKDKKLEKYLEKEKYKVKEDQILFQEIEFEVGGDKFMIYLDVSKDIEVIEFVIKKNKKDINQKKCVIGLCSKEELIARRYNKLINLKTNQPKQQGE